MDRHTEKPGPDHQLDVLQLMPERWDGYRGEKYVKPASSALAANKWRINSRHAGCLYVCLWVWWGGLHLTRVFGSGCGVGLHLSSSLCLCWADWGWRPPSFSMTPYGDPGWTPPTSHISSLVFEGNSGEAGTPRSFAASYQLLAIGVPLIHCWWVHMCDCNISRLNSSRGLGVNRTVTHQQGEEPQDP